MAADKQKRLLEAASALLEAAPDNRLNAVSLNKALFYLDLVSLRDRGETVTHNAYIALQHGPVVAKYDKRLIGKLTTSGIAKQLHKWDGSKPIVLLDACDTSCMDDELLLEAARIGQFFGEISSEQASNMSHENLGWKMAWEQSSETGKPMSIDLRLAMQQIIENDPWLDMPLTQEEKECLDAADKGKGESW